VKFRELLLLLQAKAIKKGHKCATLRRLWLREEFIKFENDPEHTPHILYVSRNFINRSKVGGDSTAC